MWVHISSKNKISIVLLGKEAVARHIGKVDVLQTLPRLFPPPQVLAISNQLKGTMFYFPGQKQAHSRVVGGAHGWVD